MKIGLDVSGKEAVRQYTSIPESPRFSKSEKAGAVRLDIAGMYTDVNAYGVHGRTAEEVKAKASGIDVATTRDYMTVMSNTMSGDDYMKAMEEGFDPADMDPEDRENILDHIKAVMAESGQVVAGFNDDLTDEELKNITGRTIDIDSIRESLKSADLPDTPDNVKKIGEAVAMMSEIDSLTDGSIKYMVENDLRPTVGNIYTSTFSASGDGSRQARGYYGEDMPGYLAKKADSIDWESIEPQVEKAVDEMNIDAASREESLKDARWLIEKGIPLTEEKMGALADIRSVEFPVPARTIVAASMQAIAEGLTAKDADLSSDSKSIYRQAAELQGRLMESEIGREEARLKMSTEANIRLLKSGFSIDTASIEETISALKEAEKELFAPFLNDTGKAGQNGGQSNGTDTNNTILTESRIEIFSRTTQVVREIPSMPAALIGRVATEQDGVFTLGRAHSIGADYKARFEAAGQTYEAVGTEVRGDLGDSITKAFRNVDGILSDLGLDISAENQRAVRILGYNSMVINEEAIRNIKAADAKLSGVIRALTPGKTLALIREGVNPLDMNLDELVNHISELDHDPKREAEKYSKFLYKLEKANAITDDERASYIGIYRMLNKIERTDHAAIGRLIESGNDMTFGKLLTAMRGRGYKLDASIDDNFGLLSESIPKGISITDQIETAFAGRITEPVYEQLEEEYLRENMEQLRTAASAEDAVYDELLSSDIPASVNNVMAEEQFLNAPNDLFRTLRAYARRTDRKISETEGTMAESVERGLTEAVDEMTESMTDRDSAVKAYEGLTDRMTDVLRRMTDTAADSMVDIRSISLMYKQISLATGYAAAENYHIPAMIDGRLTDINLKLEHGAERGLVSARMDTEAFGRVQTQIRVKEERVEISFYASDRQNLDAFGPVGHSLESRIQALGYEDTDVRYLLGDPVRSVKTKAAGADNNNEAVSTKALYDIAREFIKAVRDNA